jgi:uncharacterized protein YbjT (DUF2867 family)
VKVAIFGASGMVGGGTLQECLEDPEVESVLVVGRRPTGVRSPGMEELIVPDLFDLGPYRDRFGGIDACFYCIGVSAAGMSEADYRRVTYDLTFAVLDVVAAASPDVVVCFVSGQGTDGSGQGRVMWARVKGQAENELLARSFPAFVFRPGVIQPMKGARSRTTAYRVLYVLLTPVFPILRAVLPGSVTTSVRLGRAMIRAARSGYRKPILETRDINELGSEHEVDSP